MHIPRFILSPKEESEVCSVLKECKIPVTKTEDFFIVNCPTSGPLNENIVMKRVFERSMPFATQDAMAKQYAIRAMSRIISLLPRAKTPEAKLNAIAAINSLYPLSSDIALRLINMVGA